MSDTVSRFDVLPGPGARGSGRQSGLPQRDWRDRETRPRRACDASFLWIWQAMAGIDVESLRQATTRALATTARMLRLPRSRARRHGICFLCMAHALFRTLVLKSRPSSLHSRANRVCCFAVNQKAIDKSKFVKQPALQLENAAWCYIFVCS